MKQEKKGMATSPKARRPAGDPRREGALDVRREDILSILSIRFHWDIDEHKAELAAGLERIDDDERLRHLLGYAVRCTDLSQFHQSLLPTSKLAARIDPKVRREIVADWARHYFAADLDLVEVMLEEEKQQKALHERQVAIVKSLEVRFGYDAWKVLDDLDRLPEEEIGELSHLAIDCADLASFHQGAFTRGWARQQEYLGRGAEAREKTRQAIIKMLGIRCGIRAGRLESDLDAIEDNDRLPELSDRAIRCPSLEEFRERLYS